MMRFARAGLVLAALVGACWAVPVFAENEEVLVARGIVKLDARDYEGAMQLFSQALAVAPDDPEANYYAGFAYVRLGRFQEAEACLNKALASDPDAAAVLFELGTVYFSTGDCDRAEKMFSRFRELSPGDDLEDAVTEYLEACRAKESILDRFQLNVTVGGQYDTNVTLEPDNPPAPATGKADFRGVAFLTAGAEILRGDIVNLGIYDTFYQSVEVELSDYDVTFNSISPTISFPSLGFVEPSIGYSFDLTLLKGSVYSLVQTASCNVLVKEGRYLATEATYEYQYQDYQNSALFTTNSARSGSLNAVGLTQNLSYEGLKAALFGLGEFDSAARTYWSYDGFWAGARAAYSIWSLTMMAEGAYGQKRYRGFDPDFGKKRFDQIQEYTVLLTYAIDKRFAVTASNVTTLDDSNVEVYSYTRNVTSLFLTVNIL